MNKLILFLALAAVFTPLNGPAARAQRMPPDVAACGKFTGNPDETIAACTRVLDRKLSSNPATAYATRGLMHVYKEQLDLAIRDFDAAIRLEPRHVFAHLGRGLAFRLKGDLDRALMDFDRLQSLPLTGLPKLESLSGRGGVLREKGEYAEALKMEDQALKLNPRYAVSIAGRGNVFRAQGYNDKAIEEYSRSIAITATPAVYVRRAEAYEAIGRPDKARADYSSALALAEKSHGDIVDVSFRRFQNMAKVRLDLLTRTATAQPVTPPAGPFAPTQADQSGRMIALVIGNAAYEGASRLANPANDAKAISRSLRDIGFEVSEGIDLKRADMDDALRRFLLKAPEARTALLFYAGHGIQIDGRNYLVPVDASLQRPEKIESDMLALDTILAGLQDSVRTNIVVLDACRDDPRVQQTASAELGRNVTIRSGLAAPSTPRTASASGAGTLIAFATAPGEIALDGDGANSPFSTALSRHVGTPGLEVQQMFTRVRAEVVAGTRNKQVPWTNSSLLGEVYLAGGR